MNIANELFNLVAEFFIYFVLPHEFCSIVHVDLTSLKIFENATVSMKCFDYFF